MQIHIKRLKSFEVLRDRLLQSALAVLTVIAYPQVAGAQQHYPDRPVTFVVPAAAGGTTDLAARMVSQPLSEIIGQSVVVENKAGGNGAIAASQVKRASADGYTLLMQYSGYHVISPHLTKSPVWQLTDFQPVANVLSAPQIIVVRADLPFDTLSEMVAYAKANPGKLNFASSGSGSLQHVTGVMLARQSGIDLAHVPYKGTGPALQDLLGGRVEMTFGTAPPFMPHIKAGTLKVLAVTGAQRLVSLPDVPTTQEAGFPGVNATSWFAVFAPAATPKPIVNKLAEDLRKVVSNPEFQRKAREQGAEADYQGPVQLDERVKRDNANWAKLVEDEKIRDD